MICTYVHTSYIKMLSTQNNTHTQERHTLECICGCLWEVAGVRLSFQRDLQLYLSVSVAVVVIWGAVQTAQSRTQLKRLSSSSSKWKKMLRHVRSEYWEPKCPLYESLHLSINFLISKKKYWTHSSVLALRIPGMEEPGGLPSMESHRIRHDWGNLAAAAARGYPLKTVLEWVKSLGTRRDSLCAFVTDICVWQSLPTRCC